jgi:hypothetical protein
MSNLIKNPSIGSRVVPWGRTARRTDMTKLTVAFRNLANAPKIDFNNESDLLSDIYLGHLHVLKEMTS